MNVFQIILLVLIFIIILIIFLYNKLIQLNNKCNNAWSSINNQLKRRNDLIPNLVEVVKNYAAFEKETLQKIIELRSKIINSNNLKEKALTSENLSNALTNLFMISEAYPALKTNTSFEKLQIELVGTEDKIAYARQLYNDCVQLYNDKILIFPNNIFAKYLKFNQKEYFKIKEIEKENVKVVL